MKIAVISDIHANFDALQSVMEDIGAMGVDAILSLGDNIGYGPEPDAVVELLRKKEIPSVIGNHELAAIQQEYLGWFNPEARTSLLRTIEMMSADSLAYAGGLPSFRIKAGARFVHGFPPDSALTYLFQVSETHMKELLQASPERLCFVGHTHDLELVSYDGTQIEFARLDRGVLRLDPSCRYIINIGSVGQPRDGNNRAKYALWDTEADTLEIRFVPYDIETVYNKILAAGLPRSHAVRLW